MTMNLIPGVESTGSPLLKNTEIIAQNIANQYHSGCRRKCLQEKEVVRRICQNTGEKYARLWMKICIRAVTDVFDDQTPGRILQSWASSCK